MIHINNHIHRTESEFIISVFWIHYLYLIPVFWFSVSVSVFRYLDLGFYAQSL